DQDGLEPDGVAAPRRLLAEQVAGAADLEVEVREAEAAAELGELLDRLEALLGVLGERLLGRRHQIRVGALRGAADAAAQLVELGEAERVGAVDEDRVRARAVEHARENR